MAERPNIFDPRFDTDAEREGFSYRRARIGWQAESERLGASLFEAPPGQATFPYHWHSANEEMLIVLTGRPSLRTPEGWRELEEGEVVAFPVGERGAHQIVNRSDETVRFLVLSEMRAPELSGYPDTGKVAAMDRAPGGRPVEGERFLAFYEHQATDYWDGEPPPETSGAPEAER